MFAIKQYGIAIFLALIATPVAWAEQKVPAKCVNSIWVQTIEDDECYVGYVNRSIIGTGCSPNCAARFGEFDDPCRKCIQKPKLIRMVCDCGVFRRARLWERSQALLPAQFLGQPCGACNYSACK